MNPTFYWMKYQMMIKPQGDLSNFANLANSNFQNDRHNSLDSGESDENMVDQEIMIGRLTASERKIKVDRYLQK
eukprot:CAMPEP_0168320930 /NCGR_PEP_ID=MMETSP0213-20121227/1966_1 /TAXON_ID=151035 /ORGANISM="Euplotes harpa, Strain FSP1.4" /LENGTH=73 /DNA_ID=CAMNT_0008322479 /DNA_START=408 /DNA_END=629 /DNA_ORIENTATION=+